MFFWRTIPPSGNIKPPKRSSSQLSPLTTACSFTSKTNCRTCLRFLFLQFSPFALIPDFLSPGISHLSPSCMCYRLTHTFFQGIGWILYIGVSLHWECTSVRMTVPLSSSLLPGRICATPHPETFATFIVTRDQMWPLHKHWKCACRQEFPYKL